MVEESLSLQELIIGFEQSLRVSYSELKISEIIKQVRNELYTVFSIGTNQTLDEARIANKYAATGIEALRTQLLENLKSFCIHMQGCMFEKNFGKTAKDYNYIGLSKKTFLVAMQYLQDKDLYEKKASEIMEDLKTYIDALDSSLIKRLLIIMELLYSLGFSTGVSTIAQFLYLGGI